MRRLYRLTAVCFAAMVIVFGATVHSYGQGTCSTNLGVPPFLAGGVTPNLLLMIDNSASMYDLAYVETADYCFDDSYSDVLQYAGYFDYDEWYAYDFTGQKFVLITAAQAASNCSSAEFTNGSLCIAGAVDNFELTSVTAFTAKGNYLNWVSASKLDIEKKILTGGKYDSTSQLLQLETRACADRRFLKEVVVESGSGATNYLTLAVRPPMFEADGSWTEGETYAADDIVSDFSGNLWIATSNGTAAAGAEPGPEYDTGVSWRRLFWENGVTYPAGAVVSDPNLANTIDEGQLYFTESGGTASGTSLGNDTGITDWRPYQLTHIEVYTVGATGFSGACQDAVEEMQKESPNQGQLKQYIDECMGYRRNQNEGDISHFNAAFNHAIHNCWYLAKHNTWPPGSGPTTAIQPACEAVYDDGIYPWGITTDNPGYVCYGVHTPSPDTENDAGYVGRCWEPPSATCEWKCVKPNGDIVPGPTSLEECQAIKSNYRWEPLDASGNECVGGGWDATGAGYGPPDSDWNSNGVGDKDDCLEQALRDYCGSLSIPEVIDPTDQIGNTEEFWNIPAVLIDSGVVAQFGKAIAVLKGEVSKTEIPSGLIQEYDDNLRIGVMTFNYDGSLSECSEDDPNILYDCNNSLNRDGASVVAYIEDTTPAHTDEIVTAINDIVARSWTPLAEAMFTAIGYYTQNSSLQLDPDDFLMDASHPDPVEAWCQKNNILLITDGSSTADRSSQVDAFIQLDGQNDTDNADDFTQDGCVEFSGSTMLDDLTWFGQNGADIFPVEPFTFDKQHITTYIVVAGSMRTEGVGECVPATQLTDAASNGGTALLQAHSLTQLEDKLAEAFETIRAGTASGSAASVISSSRGGEGAVYQAIFWPELNGPNDRTIQWAGEVHALLVDDYGNMHEDTNGDRILNPDDDHTIVLYYDTSSSDAKACYGYLNPDGSCNGTSSDLKEVRYLWSATEWLSEIDNADILSNRAGYISDEYKRYIFTWNDLDNDGIVDHAQEILPFEERVALGSDWTSLAVAADRGPVPLDFGVQTNDEVNEIVRWARGLDSAGLRSRQFEADLDHDGISTVFTWRLGDVIHSTPMVVGRPAENYHLLYRDSTYGEFADTYNKRRNVVYFGGNDGMLHAVNSGFYNSDLRKFCKTQSCESEDTAPELGAELWAYVPYNILQDLKCLKDINYEHKYFVDLRPRIFDVQIFDPADGVHSGGWGTILVGGMRFGGTTVKPGELDLDTSGTADYPNDIRQFTSAYFVLDITDPENPPTLLGEVTQTVDASGNLNEVDMGFSTVIPTVVPMKDGAATTWYLVLGSGPTNMAGESDQNAKLAVVPLSWIQGAGAKGMRIPDEVPSAATDQGGRFEVAGSPNGFVSNLITVDFDLIQNYSADTVYFGTTEGSFATSWGGKFYRLITRKLDGDGDQVVSLPGEWPSLEATNPKLLLNPDQPITAAASVGYDGENFWVYFGTGRFFDLDDKINSDTQTYYGIKEPVDCNREFTWETVEFVGTHDGTPGNQGLLRVDQIQVNRNASTAAATLSCSPAGAPCTNLVAGGVDTFEELVTYIAGEKTACSAADKTGTDGWYKNFTAARERNLGQAALLGGLLTFTTYQPFQDECLAEGLSYLYGVYYQTGTPWHDVVFATGGVGTGLDASDNVIDRISLGRGLALTPNIHVGRESGSTAFVQTSTGAIELLPEEHPYATKTGASSWKDVD